MCGRDETTNLHQTKEKPFMLPTFLSLLLN